MDVEVYDNEDQTLLLLNSLPRIYDNRCSIFLYERDSISLETLFSKDLKMKYEGNSSSGEELFTKGKYCVRKKTKKQKGKT